MRRNVSFWGVIRKCSDGEYQQWFVEESERGRIDHGPFSSWGDAKKAIAVRKIELRLPKKIRPLNTAQD